MKHIWKWSISRRTLRCTLAIAFALPSTMYGIDLGVHGGINGSMVTAGAVGEATTSTGKISPSFGAYVGVGILPGIAGIDAGLNYHTLRFNVGSGDSQFSELEIPVLLRVRAIPFISPGLGVSFDVPVSDISGDNGSRSFSSAGYRNLNANLVASLRIHIPLAPLFRLTIDGQYRYGMLNWSTGSEVFRTNSLQLLAGLLFSL